MPYTPSAAVHLTAVPLTESPFWTMLLDTEGSGHYRIGEDEIPFAAGTILCLPPHMPYEKYSDAPFSDVRVSFEQPLLREERYLVTTDDLLGTVRRTADLLMEMLLRDGSGFFDAISHLKEALVLLLRERASVTEEDSPATRVRYRMLSSFCDPTFNVGRAMADLPLCGDYVRKLFVAAYGLTPQEYLTSLRMAKARILLREGGHTVAEVSLSCGYTDPSYFARVFRAEVGMSPVAYATAPSVLS